jgi:hypothetical protein
LQGSGGGGSGHGEEDDAFNSWKSSWNQLIEGVGGSPVTGAGAGEETDESLSPVKESKPSVGKQKQSFDASDSFDISEGDFEVIPCLSLSLCLSVCLSLSLSLSLSFPLSPLLLLLGSYSHDLSDRLEHLLREEVKKKEMKEELVEQQWRLPPPNILPLQMSRTRSRPAPPLLPLLLLF